MSPARYNLNLYIKRMNVVIFNFCLSSRRPGFESGATHARLVVDNCQWGRFSPNNSVFHSSVTLSVICTHLPFQSYSSEEEKWAKPGDIPTE